MQALIVEPSHVVAMLLSALFEQYAIKSLVVGSAKEALTVLETHGDIDIVCLAYELGGMNGVDLVLAARARKLLASQPVVLFASTHDPAMLEHARQAGVTECFAKSQRAELEQFIERFVASKQVAVTRRVLLVEDSVTNRRLIEMLLKKQGLLVESVENGQEALERVTTGELPDLVLMDCHMPVMDGFEATRRIRQWEQKEGRPSLPIIALTASSTQSDRNDCQAAGMSDFLSKPVSVKELADTLARWAPSCVLPKES